MKGFGGAESAVQVDVHDLLEKTRLHFLATCSDGRAIDQNIERFDLRGKRSNGLGVRDIKLFVAETRTILLCRLIFDPSNGYVGTSSLERARNGSADARATGADDQNGRRCEIEISLHLMLLPGTITDNSGQCNLFFVFQFLIFSFHF